MDPEFYTSENGVKEHTSFNRSTSLSIYIYIYNWRQEKDEDIFFLSFLF